VILSRGLMLVPYEIHQQLWQLLLSARAMQGSRGGAEDACRYTKLGTERELEFGSADEWTEADVARDRALRANAGTAQLPPSDA
jgi:hypothetical protein